MRPIPRSSFLIIAILLAVGAVWVWANGLPDLSNPYSMQVIISYADGTPDKIIETNGIMPHAVAQVGSSSPISSVTFNVKAKPSWTMLTPTSISGVTWTCVGTVKVDGAQKQTVSLASGAPSSITNGATYTISTTTISGTTLNSWIPFDQQNHNVVLNAGVSCTFTPPGDSVKTIDGSVAGTLAVKNIGFPALLTVTIDTTVS